MGTNDSGTGQTAGNGKSEAPLDSWKAIGAYLQRNAVTVRRWEREEGLPVHRLTHKSRSSVYAYPSEIDAWRASRTAATEPAPQPPGRSWPRPLAFATAIVLCLIMVGSGLPPQVASAQERQTARQVWSGPWAYSENPPSFDGRYLPFTDWSTGDLALRDLVSGTTRPLTKTGGYGASGGDYAATSVISPNGGQVAYMWFSSKALPASDYSLRVLSLSGSGAGPRVVPHGDASVITPAAWTSDEKQLLVLRSLKDRTNQLALVSVADGAAKPLKTLGWRYPAKISLSPDGRFVAYDIAPGTKGLARDILVLPLDGSTETTVVAGAADNYSPMWSPDGSRIVFLSNRTGTDSLWSVPVRGGKPAGAATLLKAGFSRLAPMGITRNGALFYSTGGPRRNVQVAELDANLKVTKPPAPVSERYIDSSGRAAWSPDGQYLAYYSITRPNRSGAVGLVIRSLETGEERDVPLRLLLAYDPEGTPPPRWFPDGGSVLVVAFPEQVEKPRTEYYRVNIANGTAELVHSTSSRGQLSMKPDLSPDGKFLYYGQDGKLVRHGLENRQTVELTNKFIRSYAVSPDGTQLAYLVQGKGWGAVEIMPSAGGAAREVFRMTPWMAFSLFDALGWSSDGRHLLFSRAEESERQLELYHVPVTGGTPQKVGISMAGRMNFPRMHPDGRRIVLWSRQAGDTETWALENFLPRPTP